MPRRARPTPEAALAAARERRARQDELARLRAQPDLAVVADADARLVSVQRLDVFDQLLSQRAITEPQAAAARRLEGELAAAAGVGGGGRDLQKVDVGSAGAPGQGPSQRMVDAGARVQATLAACGPVTARLLAALIEPQFQGRARPWREVVAEVTGEAGRDAAGPLVRLACENLRAVYAEAGYRRG